MTDITEFETPLIDDFVVCKNVFFNKMDVSAAYINATHPEVVCLYIGGIATPIGIVYESPEVAKDELARIMSVVAEASIEECKIKLGQIDPKQVVHKENVVSLSVVPKKE